MCIRDRSSGSLPVSVGNDVYTGPTTVTESIKDAVGGNLELVSPNTTPVTTTVNDVNDTTTVTLSATPSVDENGTITYTATLTDAQGKPVTAQNGPVTVTLDSGKVITIAEGQSSGSLPVTVVVTGVVFGDTNSRLPPTASLMDSVTMVGPV